METSTSTRPPARHEPTWIQRLRDRLLADAFLFDDPRAYQAGVEDTLDQIDAYLDEG